MRVKPEWQTARSEAGLAPAPRIVVISGRLDLPWDESMFAESALGVVVVTTRSVDSHRLAVAREFAEVWQIGDHEVDLASAVAMMREHGLARIVCEGGEALLDRLVRAELVDEMDLTVSPVLAGAGYLDDPGSQAQVLASAEGSDRFARFAAAHTFMDEGFTFCKFLRKSLDEEFIV